jgi:hypothetical protein
MTIMVGSYIHADRHPDPHRPQAQGQPERICPRALFDGVIEALSIPNLAKEKAKKMDEWGWQRMPDTISLFKLREPASS